MDQLAMYFNLFEEWEVGYIRVGYYACAYVRTSFSYLWIHWMHHTEIECVVRPINYVHDTGYTRRISASALVLLNILFKHIR